MKTATQTANGKIAVSEIPLDKISVSMLEPQVQRRKHFQESGLQELSASILSKGLISPITVRPLDHGEFKYEIVAGERRYLASKLAGLTTILAAVRDLSDEDTIEIQLQENLQRMEVEPLDEAFSYQYLVDHAGYTVEKIAEKFAKTEKIIARRLKLIDLCDEGKKDLAAGKLPLAHAEAIARFPEATQNKILKSHAYDWQGHPITLKDLQWKIGQHFVLDLNKAIFDREDGKLHKAGLTCLACTKRTGFTPALFEDQFGKVDHCLVPACWNDKLKAHLVAKRNAIAEKLPNPDELSIEQLALKVPLLKRQGDTSNVNIGKGDYVTESWYSSQQPFEKVEKGKRCEFTETALRVSSEYSKNNIGTTTLICRSKECKVHQNKERSSGSSNHNSEEERLKRQEREFNSEVADRVRGPILRKHIENFDALRTVFSFREMRRSLLAQIFILMGYELEDRCPTDVFELIPKGLLVGEDEKVMAAAEALSDEEESRAFAVITFATLGYSDSYSKPADLSEVKQIASQCGLNFDLIDAQARVDLAPDSEKEEILKAHLELVKAGKASKPPSLYWPKPKVEKKPAAKKAKAAKKEVVS